MFVKGHYKYLHVWDMYPMPFYGYDIERDITLSFEMDQ